MHKVADVRGWYKDKKVDRKEENKREIKERC